MASLSPSLAGLESGFVLAPVVRRRSHSPSFFLSHLSFGNPELAKRIIRELESISPADTKGRIRLASPCGTLKVALARPAPRNTLLDVPAPSPHEEPAWPSGETPSSQPAASEGPACPRLAPAFATTTVPFTAGPSDEGRECICRQEFLSGENLQRLPCLHAMHHDCLERWMAAPHSNGRCPECNARVL